MSPSTKLAPAARMATRTSPGPGSGVGTSSTTSWSRLPISRQTTAFIARTLRAGGRLVGAEGGPDHHDGVSRAARFVLHITRQHGRGVGGTDAQCVGCRTVRNPFVGSVTGTGFG